MNRLFANALLYNNQDAMKKISMIIAQTIRNELEGFHADHIPDRLMPELNHLIRTGIYNSLFALVNYETDEYSLKFVNQNIRSIPDYWEEPKLLNKFEQSLAKYAERPIFQSGFLNRQFEFGNIFLVENTGYIRIKASFEFSEVGYDEGKKHLSKITSQLRKEGYSFNPCLDAYAKLKDDKD